MKINEKERKKGEEEEVEDSNTGKGKVYANQTQ